MGKNSPAEYTAENGGYTVKTSVSQFFFYYLVLLIATCGTAFGAKQRLAPSPQKNKQAASRQIRTRSGQKQDLPQKHPRSRARQYAEVEIRLDKAISSKLLQSIPLAPGSRIQILRDGHYAQLQIPRTEVDRLRSRGAKIKTLREFILAEGKKEKRQIIPKANPNDDWEFGDNDIDYVIPDPLDPDWNWTWSDIFISSAPAGSVVTTIDVHYEIIHPWAGDLQVDLNDEFRYRELTLHEADGESGVDLIETVYDITTFAGLAVNQEWDLWVLDYYEGDSGYIDYWWIKVYYGGSANPPDHDLCVDAIATALDIPYDGSTVGAGGTDISSCSSNDSADVWHSFTPAQSAAYLLSLCGSEFDTTLAVYDGCGGNELDCNDDACDLQSELTLSLNASQTYLIRIAGYEGEVGNYTLLISQSGPPPSLEPNFPGPADKAYDVLREGYLTWNSGAEILQNIMPASVLQTQTLITPKGIYGTDDRLDAYQVTDPDWLAVGDSVAVMVSLYEVVDNGDGTYTLPADTMDEIYYSLNNRHLCSSEPFRNQPSAGYCTGVLVAPDIIATAGHCIINSSECAEFAFVFGYRMLNSSTPVLTIDQSDLYFCGGIIDRIETYDDDWGLIQLDREVLNHAPLQVRRSGKVADGQDLLVIGYPYGVPVKYADNAWVQNNSATEYFLANLDVYTGNSGTPVFNTATLEIEGLLVAGQEDFEPVGSCDRSIVYPDTPGNEQCTRTTQFSDQIPVFDVYLGTDPGQLSLACSEVPYPWCPIGPLDCGKNYYWKVVRKENGIQTDGDTWVFSTEYVGDLNHDCQVSIADFEFFAAAWLLDSCDPINNYCNQNDLDKFGSVDISDLILLLTHWTESTEP